MNWKDAPLEVERYFDEGPHKAKSVQAMTPYTVVVTFDDGMVKAYDYTGKFTGVLSEINDPEVFKKVYIDDTNAIAWDTSRGHMDFSADSVYIYGRNVTL